MAQVSKIDENGFYMEPVIVEDGDFIENEDLIGVEVPEGLYKPRWDGIEWTEGLTQAEINALINAPSPVDPLAELQRKQELMQAALDDLILGGMM